MNHQRKSPENILITAIKKNNCDSVLRGVKDSLLPIESLKDSMCTLLKLYAIPVNYFLKQIVGQYEILKLIIQVSDPES